jgi:hypothetical protein
MPSPHPSQSQVIRTARVRSLPFHSTRRKDTWLNAYAHRGNKVQTDIGRQGRHAALPLPHDDIQHTDLLSAEMLTEKTGEVRLHCWSKATHRQALMAHRWQ